MKIQDLIQSQKTIFSFPPEELRPKAQQLAKLIKQRARPWLDATQQGQVIFYRGVRSHQNRLYYEYTIRKDRRPKDSRMSYHRAYNAVIEAAGGIANRTNSAFTVRDYGVAYGYGEPYVFIALGPFHSTYHESWRDWSVYVGMNQLKTIVKDEEVLIDADVKSSTRKLKKELAGAPKQERTAEIKFLLSEKGKEELRQKAKNKLDKLDGTYWWKANSHLMADPNIYDPAKIRQEMVIDGDLRLAQPYAEVMIQAETALMLEFRFYKHYVLPILLTSGD